MSKRKAWNATMQASGYVRPDKKGKRASGRQTVLSKTMRVVDEETRKAVWDSQLDALEADNYTEEADGDSDDEFMNEDVVEGVGGLDERQARIKERKHRKATGGAAILGQPAGGAGGGGRKNKTQWKKRNFRSLSQVVFEMVNEDEVARNDAGLPTYTSIAAPESTLPPRHFCSVCGFWGLYSCTRCGTRFCSGKCQAHHKETRCLKFSA